MNRVHNIAIELFEYSRPTATRERATAGDEPGPGPIDFQVDDLATATAYLRDQGVRVLEGPIEIPEDAPGGAVVHQYFEDPWGNQLEITERAKPLLEDEPGRRITRSARHRRGWPIPAPARSPGAVRRPHPASRAHEETQRRDAERPWGAPSGRADNPPDDCSRLDGSPASAQAQQKIGGERSPRRERLT